MAISKKSTKINRYMLSGAQKKSGVNTWRYVFTGVENTTGQERRFFIELSMLNPFLSPSEPVLGYKNRVKIQPEDLQNVLAGTISAQKLETENIETPSYVVVRAGAYGAGAKQCCLYSAIKNIRNNPKIYEISVETCFFSADRLIGHLDISPEDLQEHPEYLCDSGMINWDLHYEIRRSFDKGYSSKVYSWLATGVRAVFAGSITIDGKVYNVIPKKSFGYIDRNYGKNNSYPWLHLSSSNLTSIITGKTLQESAFAVQGIYNDRVSVIVDFEGNQVAFEANKGLSSYEAHWNFTQAPENDSQEKLHWTISVHNKKYVIDIDVFCIAPLMFVRSFELPEGKRNILKVLSGSTGTGEIRLYKRIHKNLELIEHAEIAGALCEFGQKEESES